MDDYEAKLAARPDIVAKVRSGDPEGLVEFFEQIVGVKVTVDGRRACG